MAACLASRLGDALALETGTAGSNDPWAVKLVWELAGVAGRAAIVDSPEALA